MSLLNDKDLKPGEIIPLSNPLMFKKVFSDEEHIDVLEHFVSDILEIPLEDVQGNLKLAKNPKEASNEVDVIFNNNGKIINIEFFMNDKPHE